MTYYCCLGFKNTKFMLGKGFPNPHPGDPFLISGIGDYNYMHDPSGQMSCSNPISCLLCDTVEAEDDNDSGNATENGSLKPCTTYAMDGAGIFSNPVAPCNATRCYSEKWFGNIKGMQGASNPLSAIGFPTTGCSVEYVNEVKDWLMDPDGKVEKLNAEPSATAVQVRVALIFLIDDQIVGNGYGAGYPSQKTTNGDFPCSRECYENVFFENMHTYDGDQKFYPFPPHGSMQTPLSWDPSGSQSCCLPLGDPDIDTHKCLTTGKLCPCCDPSTSSPLGATIGAEALIANTPENAALATQIVLCGPGDVEGLEPIIIKGSKHNGRCPVPET